MSADLHAAEVSFQIFLRRQRRSDSDPSHRQISRWTLRTCLGRERKRSCCRPSPIPRKCTPILLRTYITGLMIFQRGETDFFSGEPLRALSTLVFSDNVDLQRSASLTFAEITERGKSIYRCRIQSGIWRHLHNSTAKFCTVIVSKSYLTSARNI